MRITASNVRQMIVVGRLITIGLVILMGWYVHKKTQSWGWAILAALGLYVVISLIFLRNCFSFGSSGERSPRFCKFYNTQLFPIKTETKSSQINGIATEAM